MFEAGATEIEALRGIIPVLAGLGVAADDAERVDRLDVLERIKAACAAAQVRETVLLAESQAQVADEWREHARSAAEVGDFEAWRSARQNAAAASCPEADDLGVPSQATVAADGAARIRRGAWRRRSPWRAASRLRPGADLSEWRSR